MSARLAMPAGPASLNPLLQDWDTPHGLPPFALLHAEHFEPALLDAMQEHLCELALIGADGAAPDFDNTAAAFDRAGRRLSRVAAAFYNLSSSATSPELQAVQRAMAGPMSAHHSAVHMDARLYGRIEALHTQRATLALRPEQLRLLERLHQDFGRAGACLAPEQQRR